MDNKTVLVLGAAAVVAVVALSQNKGPVPVPGIPKPPGSSGILPKYRAGDLLHLEGDITNSYLITGFQNNNTEYVIVQQLHTTQVSRFALKVKDVDNDPNWTKYIDDTFIAPKPPSGGIPVPGAIPRPIPVTPGDLRTIKPIDPNVNPNTGLPWGVGPIAPAPLPLVQTFTVIATAGGEGGPYTNVTLSPNKSSYLYNEFVTIMADVPGGFQVQSWTANGRTLKNDYGENVLNATVQLLVQENLRVQVNVKQFTMPSAPAGAEVRVYFNDGSVGYFTWQQLWDIDSSEYYKYEAV